MMIASLSPLLSNKKIDKNNYDDSSDHNSLASEPTTTMDNTSSSSPRSVITKTTTSSSSSSSSRRRRRRNPHPQEVEDALWNIQKLRLSSQLAREKLFGGDNNGITNQQAVREARNSRDEVHTLLNRHYYL